MPVHDPSFVARARLWARLCDLIPKEHQAEANTIAAELNGLFWAMIDCNGELADELRAQLQNAEKELQEVQALAAAPIESRH